jgi:hypothetical protein
MTVHAATPPSITFSTAPHSSTSGSLPMTQGSGVPPTVALPLGLDFPMGPRDFDPSNLSDPSSLFAVPPASFLASGAATRLYENNAQSLPFGLFTTLASTSSMFIPLSNPGIFDPHHAGTDYITFTTAAPGLNSNLPSVGQKRVLPTVPAQDKPSKRWKLETCDKCLIDQQVGAHQVNLSSMAINNSTQATEVNAGNRNPLTSLSTASQGPTIAIRPPTPVPSFDHPYGMSNGDYLKLLHMKIMVATALDG